MYLYDQRPNTQITPESAQLLEVIKESEYAVLVGRNNCGKSYLLKEIAKQMGVKATYLGPARYHNFQVLEYFTPNRNRTGQRHSEFINNVNQQSVNVDNSSVNLQRAIAELSDTQRVKLFEIIKLLLGAQVEILHTVENNNMSQKYVSSNGHNISYTSSGFRLITTLLTSLLDIEYEAFLIDEPELGISPEAQGLLADFLFDRQHREKYFSHIKTIIFATHSTIFLDRKNCQNNYIVSKLDDLISLNPVSSLAELNKIHFFLLGNRLETLYLPSAIILVEGKTDFRFVERMIALSFPNTQISVIQANSDSQIKAVLHTAKGIFGDLQKSPYRGRIIAILDSIHSRSLPTELVGMGIDRQNVVTWESNGIEYYYPSELLDTIYGTGGSLEINDDRVSKNGLTYNKNELADKVCNLLTNETQYHNEFKTKLLNRIAEIVS